VNLDDLWTGILETTAQIIIPVWNDLIALIPFAVALLFLAILGAIALLWLRHAGDSRPRVPKPLPAGRQPDDMHLPGPSLWPFVAPVGLLFLVFALALGPLESLVTLGLLLAGLVVATIGLIGWYLDAGREYVAVEAGGHGSDADAIQPPAWSLSPPEGVHLPGPSAWPLLAPVGLLFLASGLLFGPAMFIGGAVMAVIAMIGWLLDARHELDDIEAHGNPSQADRDPERAWPSRLIPIYFLVGAAAIILTLLPWLVSLLPSSGA
jgi:hypothetical protein